MSNIVQTVVVTIIAAGALGMIARRLFATKLPAAFRPSAQPPACDHCPVAKDLRK